jgi:hypothetical protein
MLRECKVVGLIDLFPTALDKLRPELEEAGGRFELFVKCYRPTDIPGAKVWLNPNGDAIVERYQAVILVLLTDGAELLVAWLSQDGSKVRQALWTASPTLVHLFHTSFLGEIQLVALEGVLAGITEIGQLEELMRPLRDVIVPRRDIPLAEVYPMFSRWFSESPGFQRLMQES